jgi:hypothetical protein
MNSYLRMYSETLWHFMLKDRLVRPSVLLRGVHHLQTRTVQRVRSCFIIIPPFILPVPCISVIN